MSIENGKTVIPGQYITPEYKYNEASNIAEKYVPGRGASVTEIINENSSKVKVIVSTLLGKVLIKELEVENKDQEIKGNIKVKSFVVMVVSSTNNSYLQFDKEIHKESTLSQHAINLPQENDIVLVKITKLNQRQAFCEILSVEGSGNVLKDEGIGSNGESAHLSLPSGGGSQSLSSHQTIASSQSTSINAVASDLGETFKGIIRSQDVRSTDRDKVKIIDSFRPGDIVRAIIISLGDGSNYYLSTARNDLGVVFAKSEGGAGDLLFPVDWQTTIDRRTGLIENRKCAKPFIE